MDRREKEKSQRDLKSYFNRGSSATNPSTRESGNVEVEVGESVGAGQVEELQEQIQLGSVQVEDVIEEETVQGDLITEFNPDYIVSDPGLRIPIDRFAPNIRDEVRRAFIAKGPTQPTGHNFPPSKDKRSFQKNWFKQYNWLEYSLEKDMAFCFYCYLFKHDRIDDKFGYDVFTKVGFQKWKNAYMSLRVHVGGANSIHNQARTAFDDFDNQRSSVKHKVSSYNKESLIKYETRLETSLGIVSFLALQGEPFRGHDETDNSLNKRNFLELLDWYKQRNEEVKRAFDELYPKNAKMTSGTIQKELANCCAEAVTKAIKEEMRDCLFSVLIDESRDVSIKEQMTIVVRFVNNKGEAKAFCEANNIPIPNMEDAVPRFGRSRKGGRNNITQDHYFRVDTFYAVIDAITNELDHRFNEVSSELLVCFSCLDPRDSFSKFDVDKLARLTEIYYEDFSFDDRKAIKDQLKTFIIHVRRLDEFKVCHDLASLAKKLVELERHIVFPLVYRLIELALLLPVATASVERAFSAMKIIKTELRNKMSDG